MSRNPEGLVADDKERTVIGLDEPAFFASARSHGTAIPSQPDTRHGLIEPGVGRLECMGGCLESSEKHQHRQRGKAESSYQKISGLSLDSK